ncbi:MAG: arginase [Thauera propionica]|jgi:arginase|nr:arginase [Thauera propionica]
MTLPAGTPQQPEQALALLGAASALGAPDPGSARGPSALEGSGLVASLRAAGRTARWSATLEPSPLSDTAHDMRTSLQVNGAFATRLADAIAGLPAGEFPLILGGDHAIATGTWRGVGHRIGQAPGLIWIDAHLDSHTAHTTHSGNIHGMPLAALLGEGAPELTDLPGPCLDPARCCVVGARAWEAEEHALLQRLGVRIFTMDEVHRRGLHAVMGDALAITRAGGRGFGLSLDLDALDPGELPAVTCPEPDGLGVASLAAELRRLRACPDFVAMEIVEYRPDLDPDGLCAARIVKLAQSALGRETMPAPSADPSVAKVQ